MILMQTNFLKKRHAKKDAKSILKKYSVYAQDLSKITAVNYNCSKLR